MTEPASQTTGGDDKADRDVSRLVATDWERREPPSFVVGRREDRFQAVVRQSVLNQIHRHGLAAREIEVCGVLVGNVYHDGAGPWLYVEYAIEGNHAAQKAAQVTFTADTWTHIQATMDRDYPEKRILGWYHTHPGFGIFLSDMDLFIQDNFFPEPWQVALVYDPKAKEEGVFFWKKGRPDTDAFLVEADAPQEELTTTVKGATAVPQYGGMGADIGPFAERLAAVEKRQKVILAVLALLTLVAVAWPLAVTAFLPEVMRKLREGEEPAPKIQLPSDDPTSRRLKM
jgi:proteasome lid subunit RPN8/RPN11